MPPTMICEPMLRRGDHRCTKHRCASCTGYVALILLSDAVPGVPAFHVSWSELQTTLHESANLFYIVSPRLRPSYLVARMHVRFCVASNPDGHMFRGHKLLDSRGMLCRTSSWTDLALRLCLRFPSIR